MFCLFLHRGVGRLGMSKMNPHNNKNSFEDRPYNRRGNRSRGSEREPQSSSGNGRPKGLKGKEIGLYYAAQARMRREIDPDFATNKAKHIQKKQDEEDKRSLGRIHFNETKRQKIKQILTADKSNFLNYSVDNKTYSHIENSKFKSEFLSIIKGNIMDKIVDSTFGLVRDQNLDQLLYSEYMNKLENDKYLKMSIYRNRLPAKSMAKEIVNLIEENQVVVISGETGCGKTTQVAQFILDDYLTNNRGSICNIVCTQPRRISAISVAERVAAERAEKLGQSVGYQIRLEKQLPRRDVGNILFCTTGVLLKKMENNPSLSDLSHLIIDEIHERDVISDFLITLLKEVIKHRKDLKVILMSATLNSEAFSKYYNNAPHINIPGFTHPVEEFYLEDVLERTKFRFKEKADTSVWKIHRNRDGEKDVLNEFHGFVLPYVRQLEGEGKYSKEVCHQLKNPNSEKLDLHLILALLTDICEKEKREGSVLVFVTGFAEISDLIKLMDQNGRFPRSRYTVIPLHSQMPTMDQKQIFEPSQTGKRKIIISTNIAETSITIDDVVFVIDCGKIKISEFNPATNTEILSPQWVSMANAHQRRGRAGRVRPGVCYHLYTRGREMTFSKFMIPEVLRKRLDDVILTAKILQLGKVQPFFEKLMDAPAEEAVAMSLDILVRMNALTEDETLTPLGFHLAKLPMGPQVGKMVIYGALFGCLDPILSVAASLDFKDAFQLPLGKQKEADQQRSQLGLGDQSDHLLLHTVLELFHSSSDPKQFCWDYFLSYPILQQLHKMKKQFMLYLMDMGFVSDLNPKSADSNVNSDNKSLIKAIVCAGLYPNVAIAKQRKRPPPILRSIQHEKLSLHPKSTLTKERLHSSMIVYFLKLKTTGIMIHDGTVIHPLPIVFFGDKYAHCSRYGDHFVGVCNGKMNFKCPEQAAIILKKLRDSLCNILEYKLCHPDVIKWENGEKGVDVLRTVIDLITEEDGGITWQSDGDDDDDVELN